MPAAPTLVSSDVDAEVLTLNVMLHFEMLFDQVLKENNRCPRAAVAEMLAKETVDWIEGYDKLVTAA
jgi:hypothetical protein